MARDSSSSNFNLVHIRLPQMTLREDRTWLYGEGHEEVTSEDRVRTADFAKGITHNVDRDQLPAGARNVALVTTDGERYTALCLLRKERATSTFQDRVRLHRIRPIDPIHIERALEELTPQAARWAERTVSRTVATFSSGAGEQLVTYLRRSSSSFKHALKAVLLGLDYERVIHFGKGDSPWRIVAEEKDSVDTVLKIAGLPTTSLAEKELDEASPDTFLRLLGLSEDQQIQVDLENFAGLRFPRRDVRGVRVFSDTKSGGFVTVINVNRNKIETTVGVDLVVHFSRYKSFLCVQYKRLTKAADPQAPATYWPDSDKNFRKEMRAMLDARTQVIGQRPICPADYRLSDDPFFFKFCRSDEFDPDELGMVKGLYFPAADIHDFLQSEFCKGPQGGRQISYDKLERRFSNTLFTSLAQEGWIGSRSVGSKALNRYLSKALEGDRSVMIAELSQTR